MPSQRETPSIPDLPRSIEPATLLIAPAGRSQESLRVLLSAYSLKVIGAVAESRSALALAQEWRPALVVLDFGLPGDEASTILKRFQVEWPTSRCLALVATMEQSAEASAGGAQEVLLKGFRIEELYAAINRLLINPLDEPKRRLNRP